MSYENVKCKKKVVPMIYAYATPDVTYHDGYVKIGYTEQDVDTRIKQQTHTPNIYYEIKWKGNAIYEDGSGETFKDTDFHSYLRKLGVKQPQDEDNDKFEDVDRNEWFKISPEESKQNFNDFRENRGITQTKKVVKNYVLRDEQKEAVDMALNYMKTHNGGEVLWNAKPRFGKTLSTYDFCKKIGAKNILIVTNRPAIAKSWFNDYEDFLGSESNYLFVSEVNVLKGLPGVISREEYTKSTTQDRENSKYCIEFVSLQDLKGSKFFGGNYNKLKEVKDIDWDVLVIDEAHEGVDTYKTDVAFDNIKRKFTLHLSGTPFKALANDKFKKDAIFNWTYLDEQKKKKNWDNTLPIENPYINLPELQLYTYQMSEIISDEVKKGIDIDGENVEYAFDLNEFFKTNNNGDFIHDSDVNKFLDSLSTKEKFPFSTNELREEIKHSLWLLDRVDSAKALAKKLQNHPVFKDYKVVLAAGDGRIDDNDENDEALNKVIDAIKTSNKNTITLSVGQLTTGVTIPEWTAVLMLSNLKSPSLYMQAAFRAQNPCLFHDGSNYERKIRSYVFDFDPARTLIIYEKFANDLSNNTYAGNGTLEDRKQNIKELLNFFPVVAEDDEGKMILLDAEKVLSIPRKIKSKEVVKRGFMSDFLFTNITHVFNAPSEVTAILDKLTPVKNPKNSKINIDKKIEVDENGNVLIDNEYVIGKSKELFGDKVFIVNDEIDEVLDGDFSSESLAENNDGLMNLIKNKCISPIMKEIENQYAKTKKSDTNEIENDLKNKAQKIIQKNFTDNEIIENTINAEKEERLKNRNIEKEKAEDIEKEYNDKLKEALKNKENEFKDALNDFFEESKRIAVETIETNIKEREKRGIEDDVKDHLRGFSRTIPSFLMAYGDDNVKISNFDQIIPENVFLEVTSITIDQFKFLRDGGDYVDNETNENKHFEGHIFDEVVFDDSIKEFMSLKKKLANYFDENNKEDIFDYVPPQQTNQIFTPKNVVKLMIDMLEEENPFCFDDPNKTFIDMYMKSGLYIAEIVKRLYNNKKMKEIYKDDKERLIHIFEKQVFGLAPTEIIYKISTNFILGFDEEMKNKKHNFKLLDIVPYAKDKKASEKLDELYK